MNTAPILTRPTAGPLHRAAGALGVALVEWSRATPAATSVAAPVATATATGTAVGSAARGVAAQTGVATQTTDPRGLQTLRRAALRDRTVLEARRDLGATRSLR